MKYSDIKNILETYGFGRFNRFLARILGYKQIQEFSTWYRDNRPRLKYRDEPDLNIKQLYDLIRILINYKKSPQEYKMVTLDLIVDRIIADLKINLTVLMELEAQLTPKLIDFFIRTRFEVVYHFLVKNHIELPLEHMFYAGHFSKKIIILLEQLKRVDRLNEAALDFIANLDEKSILKLTMSKPWIFTANKWDIIRRHQNPPFAIRALAVFNFLMTHKIHIRFISFLQLKKVDLIVNLLEEIIYHAKHRRHICQPFFDALVHHPREELIQGYKTILNSRGTVSDEEQVALTEATNCLEFAQSTASKSFQKLSTSQKLNVIWHPNPMRLTQAYCYFNEIHWRLDKNKLESMIPIQEKPDEFVGAISKLHLDQKLSWDTVVNISEKKTLSSYRENKATIFKNIDTIVIDVNKGQCQCEIRVKY